VFSTINRYTLLVSDVVRRHGGSIVEFNGDGMMAVFGAPIELPDKERAAICAGLAVCESMIAQQTTLASVPLAVGIGIATGPAFVGNVHAADRLIWTAIGSTINLAARLQSLTRDLGAAIVVDVATWRAGGAAVKGFVSHQGVPIRGLREAQDLSVLPLAALEETRDDIGELHE
jgi:adenylate cyclase